MKMAKRTTDDEDGKFSRGIRPAITIELAVVLDWVQKNVYPEEIYDGGELDEWATANGWVKSEIK